MQGRVLRVGGGSSPPRPPAVGVAADAVSCPVLGSHPPALFPTPGCRPEVQSGKQGGQSPQDGRPRGTPAPNYRPERRVQAGYKGQHQPWSSARSSWLWSPALLVTEKPGRVPAGGTRVGEWGQEGWVAGWGWWWQVRRGWSLQTPIHMAKSKLINQTNRKSIKTTRRQPLPQAGRGRNQNLNVGV